MAYLHKDREQFADAINLVVYKTGLEPQIVEKDYYVTMILKRLAERFDFVVFKGGTSLSKCHRVISRFSEDIDISIDNTLSQGQKRKLKECILTIADEIGLSLLNPDEIRSRRDYNRYMLAYDSVLNTLTDTVQPVVLMETFFAEVSFPTLQLPVHSYVGDLFEEEAPDAIEEYDLSVFTMKVQGLDRTLVDTVFAICDYYLKGEISKHSRHIYDIHKLLPMVLLDVSFKRLVQEVRAIRAKVKMCASAQHDVNVTALLYAIVSEACYKEDYNMLTVKLLADKVSYDEAVASVLEIANSGMFD